MPCWTRCTRRRRQLPALRNWMCACPACSLVTHQLLACRKLLAGAPERACCQRGGLRTGGSVGGANSCWLCCCRRSTRTTSASLTCSRRRCPGCVLWPACLPEAALLGARCHRCTDLGVADILVLFADRQPDAGPGVGVQHYIGVQPLLRQAQDWIFSFIEPALMS